MMKRVLIAGAAVVAFLSIVVLGLSVFLEPNQFRPKLEEEMASALGRKVTLGTIRLSLLSGGVSVENVSIGDDPAFSSEPFLTAKAVAVGVELMPLIVSRDLRVRSFTLEEPQMALRRSSSGTWNFSSLAASATSSGTKPSGSNERESSPPPSVSVRKLTIANGEITVGASASHARSHVYRAVNIEATDLSYTSRFPFLMSAKTPGDGVLKLEGQAGPLSATDVAATPLQGTVDVQRLDVAATGFIDPASGIAGLIDFTGRLVSDGRRAQSKGTLHANKLQLVQGSSPARVPIEVVYESAYDLKNQRGEVQQGDVHVGKALAHLTGTFSTGSDATTVRMKLAGRQMPVPELEASLPAIGVTLPAGASLQGGTLDLDLTISGPLDRLVTTGPVNMANTRLTGFDLGSKLATVAALTGLRKSADTIIQTLGATLRIEPEGIQASDLQMIVPTIGRLFGNGTIASQGRVNFKMLATLTSTNAVVGRVARVASLGQQENGIPFRIEGTTANPVFVPDISAAVGNLVKTPSAATKTTGFLSGLLDKKTKRPR